MVKISVIVPVYNPGANIDECLSSLLGQSLPDDEYELIFVDDGSTDETPAHLDELARTRRNVRVEHIPNSGWPGRPRNIGLELARGEFVYFVDNDDWLGRRALERLYASALRNESDIVVGKVVGHGKTVSRALFQRNRRAASLEWPALLGLLTPHKLFRKSLLDEHRIRFEEGPRRLEDHLFVVHAYFHARRISVLATYPCYHWRRVPDDSNASWRRFDPVGYHNDLRAVLDLVDRHTEPGPLRDGMYAHWYRGKLLARVGGESFLRRDPEYRRALYEEIRRLTLERYGPEFDAALSFKHRLRARLLRQDGYEALEALAEFESGLRADVMIRRLQGDGESVGIELEARLGGEREPFTVHRRGARMYWLAPEAIRKELPEEALDVTNQRPRGIVQLPRGMVQLLLKSTRDGSEFMVPTASEIVLVSASPSGQEKRPVVIAAADVERGRAAAGSRLPPGEWEVQVLVDVGGMRATTSIVHLPARWRFGRRRRRTGTLTLLATWDGRLLPRPPFRRRIARRFPRAASLAESFRRRGRGAVEPAGGDAGA